MSSREHHGHDRVAVPCAILTVSDTRTVEDDRSGQRIRALLDTAGHVVVHYEIVPDAAARIAAALRSLPAAVEVALINGGTGITPRDVTCEAVEPMFEKPLHGFGELFRMLSYDEIGAAAMLSRAVAGIVAGRAVFAMPGSTAAVELAMCKLILPQLGHVAALLGKHV